MPGDFLLDTNMVIAIFAGERKLLRKLKRATVFLPAVVVGELLYGARKSTRTRENVTRIEEFIQANVVLPCDVDTARYYGQIKRQLRRQGRPLPENDIWIAAVARQHDLTLISRDSHFQEVDGNFSIRVGPVGPVGPASPPVRTGGDAGPTFIEKLRWTT